MKLAVTEEEFARLEDARRILGEINTSLRHRGIDVYFTVTTARDGVLAEPDDPISVFTDRALTL